MMTTGLIYDQRFLDHDTGPSHPERPQRLTAIMQRLQQQGLLERVQPIAFGPADIAHVHRVHSPHYIDRLIEACHTGSHAIDVPDSAIGPDSYDVAMLAAGGVLAAVDRVMQGHVENAFCVVRPPGHHAERDRSMGFCLLNNIAIAADYLVTQFGLSRVAIVDFDVHHGNGTQHTFEMRSDVLFISLHEHPMYLYPGTGFEDETGIGEGEGFTVNLTLKPDSGDDEYMDLFERRVLPLLHEYDPQFVLVSAGFDAAGADPLAHLNVTSDGFAWMTRQLRAVARQHCDGRLVSTLEGGYDLDALSDAVARHVTELLA